MSLPNPSYSGTPSKSSFTSPFSGTGGQPDAQDGQGKQRHQARLQSRASRAQLLDCQDYEEEEYFENILPPAQAHLVEALLGQLAGLTPPLANKRADLVLLFQTIKLESKTFKVLLRDYGHTEKGQSLQQQLTRLIHDLQTALQSTDKIYKLNIRTFGHADIQPLCQGLTLCVPISGPRAFKNNKGNCRMLQVVTAKLLERAMELGLPESVGENGQVLDILNWVAHGIKAEFLTCDDTITKVFTRALVLLESWSGGDHSEQLLDDHNVGKCAVQIQVMYDKGLVDLDWKNPEGKGLDNFNRLKQCALNFCAQQTLHSLITSGEIVSLLNICNTVKNFIEGSLLTKEDTGLLPALRQLVAFIGKLPEASLIDSNGDADCKALSNFSNFLRILAEQKVNNQPFLTGELPQFDATCTKLVACINSKAFKEAAPNSQALSNLISFIKRCDKRLASSSAPAAQAALISAAGCLTELVMADDPAAYTKPESMSGLLAGLAYLWERNLIVRSDNIALFMRQLVAQAGILSVSNWTDKSRKIVLPHLQLLVKENVLSLEQMQPALRHILGITEPVTMGTLIASSKRLGAITEVVVPLPLLTKAPAKEVAAPVMTPDKSAEKPIPGMGRLLTPESTLATTTSLNSPQPTTAPRSTTYRRKEQAPSRKTLSNTQPVKTSSLPTYHSEPIVSLRPGLVIVSQQLPALEASATTPVKQKLQSPDEKKTSIVTTAKQKPQTLPVEQKSLPVKNASGGKAPQIKPVQTKQKQTAGAKAKSDNHSQIMQAIMQGKPETVREIMANQGKWPETAIHLLLNAFFAELDLIDNKIIIAFDIFIQKLIEKQAQAALPLLRLYFEKNPPQFSGINEKLIERGIIQKKNNALPAPHATKPEKNKTISTDENGKNPLMYACENGDLNSVLKLLEMGETEQQVMQQSNTGFNALILATHKKNNKIANLLLTLDSKDKQAVAKNNVGWNALIHAITVGNTEIASLLLALDSKDKQAEATDKVGWNALMHAIYEENTDIATVLLALDSKDKQAEATDNKGWNALIHAIRVADTKIASLLLALDSKDKQAAATDKEGWNALMLAINQGNTDIVTALLALDSKDKQAEEKNIEGWNALMVAIHKKNNKIANLLLTLDSKDKQATTSTNDRWNPLMLAIDRGHTDLAASLLALDSKNIQAIAINKDGWNALMLAIDRGHTDLAASLLALDSQNIQATTINKDGWNALTFAVKRGHPDLAALLLTLDSKEVQNRGINKYDWTALMTETDRRYNDLVAPLLALDSKNIQAITINKDGWNALMSAIDQRYNDLAASLLALDSKNIQATTINKNGWNPLMLAIDRGHTDIALSLLTLDSKNIQAKAINKDGWNALMFAKKTQNTTVIEALQALNSSQ